MKVISNDEDPSGRKRRQAVTIRKMEIDDLAPVGDVCIDLEERVAQLQNSGSPLEAKIRFHTIIGGYELPEKGRVIQALKSVFSDRGLPWSPQG